LQSGSELGDAELAAVPGAAAASDAPALLLGGAGLGLELPESELDVGRLLTGPSMALRDTPSLRSKQLPIALASLSAGLIRPVCSAAATVVPNSATASRAARAPFTMTALLSAIGLSTSRRQFYCYCSKPNQPRQVPVEP
jgi:hypothetical protein